MSTKTNNISISQSEFNLTNLNNTVNSTTLDFLQLDSNVSLNSSETEISNIIPFVSQHQSNPYQNHDDLITIKRCNKLLEAANLPVIVTVNPRSLYNKQAEFRTLIEQTFVSSQKLGTVYILKKEN